MSKKITGEIIKLMRTRKFTVVTHDRGEYSIYVGRFYDYEDLPEKPDCIVSDNGCDDEGYLPAIVTYMVEALGGNSLSV